MNKRGCTIDIDAIEAAVRRLTIEQDAGTSVVIEGMAHNLVPADGQLADEGEGTDIPYGLGNPA